MCLGQLSLAGLLGNRVAAGCTAPGLVPGPQQGRCGEAGGTLNNKARRQSSEVKTDQEGTQQGREKEED